MGAIEHEQKSEWQGVNKENKGREMCGRQRRMGTLVDVKANGKENKERNKNRRKWESKSKDGVKAKENKQRSMET